MKTERALIKKMLRQKLYMSYWHVLLQTKSKITISKFKIVLNELK
jgi:hypothetical protein